MASDSPFKWPDKLPASIQGTAVTKHGWAVLIVGRSGSGKSSLALQMMSLGATLISDDICWLTGDASEPAMVSRPPTAPKRIQIEARNFGLLDVPDVSEKARLGLIVDLNKSEEARLPPQRFVTLGQSPVRYLRKVDSPTFPAMLMQYLRQYEPKTTAPE